MKRPLHGVTSLLLQVAKVIASVLVIAILSEPSWAQSLPHGVTFQERVLPIIEDRCQSCHSGKDAKGEVRLHGLTADPQASSFDGLLWEDVLAQISSGEMPPAKADSLTTEDRRLLTTWIAEVLRMAEESQRYAAGRVLLRRLTRYEYANTMRDLLALTIDVARDLPPEPSSQDGFLNNGSTLEMSGMQVEAYLAAARRALQEAIVEGERPEVYRYYAQQTAVGKLPRKKDGGHVPVNPEFLLDIPKFPRHGEFRLLIRAGAQIPPDQGNPRLRVSLGNVPGIIHVPRKLVGEVEISSAPHSPQTIELRGRIEDYPQPGDQEFGANVDFDGMIALLDFVDAEGEELRYADQTYTDPASEVLPSEVPPDAVPTASRNSKHRVAVGPRYNVHIDAIEFEAPYFPTWPPPSHRRWMSTSPEALSDAQRAEEILSRFMPAAFRRPVDRAELDQLLNLFQSLRPSSESFEAALRETLAAVLVSPHFLYIVEQRSDQVAMLSPHELAVRLSYFLWSSLPDPRLVDAMSNFTALHDSDPIAANLVLEREVNRLLDDARGQEYVNHFADQWFGLDGLERVAVNPEFYPDFDNSLKDAMREETRRYFGELVMHNLSALEILDSDWAVVNRQLAQHYELQTLPRSAHFSKVALDASDHRGGVLTQGAFLLTQSDGERPHPIRRAVWILERMLDDPPAPPPPDVPELNPETAGAEQLTLKELLENHRNREACRSCHEGIDPWGIPLEYFDATGRWREESPRRITEAKGQLVAAAASPKNNDESVLPDGSEIIGSSQLKKYLVAEKKEEFARSLVKRLASYALGRDMDFGDRSEIDQLTQQFVEDDLRMRHLIVRLVQSSLFQSK